jgi:TRAP-type C4-dicarboxylate transport system substrate-binding protein
MRASWIVLAGCLAAFGCGGAHRESRTGGALAAHTTKLRAEIFVADPGLMQTYAGAVKRASGGTLTLTFNADPYRDVGFERQIIADVRAGHAALGAVAARVWDTTGIDDFQALLAPFAITTYSLQQRVLESPIAREMLAGLSRHGLTGLALLPGDMRRLLGIDRPYVTAADFRGARIGMQDSRVAAATFRALGATPVALANETDPVGVGGYEQQLGSIASNGYFNGAHAVTTNLILWPRPIVLFANPHLLAALSPQQRHALVAAGRTVIPQLTRADEARDRDGAAQLCRAKLPLTTATLADLRQLAAATGTVEASLAADPVNRRFMRAIRALRSLQDRPLVPSCPHRETTPAGRATPLDGVYRRTVTAKQDARAEHLPLSQAVPENYGNMVLVIDRGRFATTQINAKACTWAYGTAVLQADHLIEDVIDGGGIAPTRSQNKPGEHFVFRPTLYHDTLKLTSVGPGPTTQTFQRTHEPPGFAALERRCRPPASALAR